MRLWEVTRKEKDGAKHVCYCECRITAGAIASMLTTKIDAYHHVQAVTVSTETKINIERY